MPRSRHFKASWHSRNYFMGLLNYDSDTGVFTWKIDRQPGIKAGTPAGWIEAAGYVVIEIDGHAYKAHRLAWLFVYGRWITKHTDHVNRIKNDNRICNLRKASKGENVTNSKVRTDSKSGIKGVIWAPRQKRWKVQVRKKGRKSVARYFLKLEVAIRFRQETVIAFFGDFAK